MPSRSDHEPQPTHPPPFRVALVGFGPRGFGCLERLALEVARNEGALPRLEVTAHDPGPHPGAGPPYDPGQPEGLLLNFSARHVNLWSEDHDLVPRGERLDLTGWLALHHPEWASGDAFVPRRLLGAYLRDAFASLRAALPPKLRFRQLFGVVRRLEPSGRMWTIRHDNPALDLEAVDQVMVATGHGTWSMGTGSSWKEFEAWSHDLPPAPGTRLIPAVYPAAERLGRDQIPEGSVVGIRGFALTAIDAMLALTEGRGGRFEEVEGSCIPRYQGARGPGGDEVTLCPFSRTGLPLLAKPGAELVQRSAELGELWEELRRGILESDGLAPEGLLERLHQAEMQALAALGGRIADPAAVDPLQVMEHSVRVACGDLPPDRSWARGEAWRQAYPAVVARASHGGMAASLAGEFSRLARTMERYAFGPPASTLARMVALAAAGRMELGTVRAPRIQARDGKLLLVGPSASPPLDVLLNAVIPPPGVHGDTPLLLRLVEEGHASRAPGWEGLRISPSAASLGRGGRPTPGLSVVGRATEGWVVGNDTLSRTLHDHTRRWARRVIQEAGAS